MRYELRGWFEYSDPYEPINFIFDEETATKLGGKEMWCLSELAEKIDPACKTRSTYVFGKDEHDTSKVKWYKITLEECDGAEEEFDLDSSHYKLGVVPAEVYFNYLLREIESIKERLECLEEGLNVENYKNRVVNG